MLEIKNYQIIIGISDDFHKSSQEVHIWKEIFSKLFPVHHVTWFISQWHKSESKITSQEYEGDHLQSKPTLI
jgi:hypothetical protein